MSEEPAIVELDTDIVKTVLVDAQGGNAEIDIKTPYIVREVLVTQRQRIPLYTNGTLKSTDALAALGLTVREYTRLEVETEQYASYYEQNPTLATRVRQYAAILTAYGLEATATSDQIAAAIQADTTKTDAEKTTAAASLLTLIHDIEINVDEVCPGEGLTAWTIMPKLIRYLPAEGEGE